MSETLKKLSAKFDTKDVKQRSQGGRRLDYISIDATIRRFNDVLGESWSTHLAGPIDVRDIGNGKHLAIVSIALEALGKTAVGTGADSASDVDKAIKTALAEAIKKAGHQYGVGLYLWDEEEREIVQRDRNANAGDINALKAKAFEVALEQGAEANAASIAKTLGIKEADLQDADKLRAVLGMG